MKYSTKLTKKCAADAPKVATEYKELVAKQAALARALKMMSGTFKTSATKDLNAWDCNAMFPAPTRRTINWISAITEAGKKAFGIYNQVKGMIGGPQGEGADGAAAGGSGLPGLDSIPGIGKIVSSVTGGGSEELDEFTDFEDLLDTRFIGTETDAEWNHRVKLHDMSLAACNNDRKRFENVINSVDRKITTLATGHPFGKLMAIPDDVVGRIPTYNKAVLATVKDNATMTAEEISGAKTFYKDIQAQLDKTEAITDKYAVKVGKMQAALTK